MPDAINHLEAYNRIAKAIEDKIAQINVAPVQPIINIDMSGVVEAIKGIKLECNCSGGGSSGGGSSGGDMTKLIEKIDQLICVIVPIANSQHQLEKELGYWMEDGPGLGIDAPPGSFIFPKPNDYSPPIISTPNPNPTPTNPSTGEWTTPPTIGNIEYVEPPGGMAGSTDMQAYTNYKCNAAYTIILAIKSNYDIIRYMAGYEGTLVSLGVGGIFEALKFLNGVQTGPMIQGVLGPYRNTLLYDIFATFMPEYQAASWQATIGRVVTGSASLGAMLVATIILEIFTLGLEIATAMTQMMDLLEAHKAELACALYKARTIGEAKENFITVIDKYADTLFEKLIGRYGNGQLMILNYLLTDELLAMLFACPVEVDPTTLPNLSAGGCTSCILCKDMDVTINVGLSSDANYPDLLDKTGLVPYPLTYEISLHKALAVCVQFSTDNQTTGGGSNVPTASCAIYKDNVLIKSGAVRVGVGISQEILLPCPVAGYFDQTPIPFDGNYVIKMTCAGTVGNKPKFTMETVSYREETP